MKNYLILFLLIFSFQNLFAQNLLFIGSNSYPSTETFTLKSGADFGGHDLNISIAKNNDSAIISLSTESMTGVLIKGKIVIYLDDGTVITCIDRKTYDHVDNTSTTIFYLTKSEIEKLKISNINTIRFTLKCGIGCTYSTEEGNYSAKNISQDTSFFDYEKTDVPLLIQNLFN